MTSPLGEAVALSTPVGQWPVELLDCYRTNAGPLTGYLTALVGDPSLAQDLAHESFVRMFGRWRHVEHPRAYVYLTALNLAREHWRRTARERSALESVDRLATPSSPAPDSWLRDLVDQLPKHLRIPVLLHYYADLPIEQVSAVTHLPVGTTKRRLHEARQLLHDVLEASDA